MSDLRVESREGIVYATLAGDIDMSNVQQLRDALGRATSNQALGLVLDLSAVDYLDSAGLHLVHSLGSQLRSHGQKLAVVIPAESVINDALRLAGLNWESERIARPEDAPQLFGATASPPDPERCGRATSEAGSDAGP